jgi:glycosyltransferase involved in cell wall biosynthesis
MPDSVTHSHTVTEEDLRVMHVLRSPVGGLFRHVNDLAREQCKRGLRVGIVCDSTTGSAFSNSTLDELGSACQLGVHRIPMSRIPGFSDFGVIRKIGDIVRNASLEIIHGHGAKGAAYARMLARGIGAKAVFTPHGGSLHYTNASLGGAIFLGLERLLKNRTDGIIFESEFAERTFEKNIGAVTCASRIVHNGLYDDEFVPLPADDKNHDFVFIGEIRALKGISVLLDAIEQLASEMDFSVLIVGNGDQETFLKSRISEAGLQNRVTLSAAIHPATKALQKARCMLMPSLGESFPYIVLECLAAGVPILATRVGGIPEIFGPHSAILLPPGDVNALTSAMRQFMLNPAAAFEDAASLRNRVMQNFSVSQMASKTIDFYCELTN